LHVAKYDERTLVASPRSTKRKSRGTLDLVMLRRASLLLFILCAMGCRTTIEHHQAMEAQLAADNAKPKLCTVREVWYGELYRFDNAGRLVLFIDEPVAKEGAGAFRTTKLFYDARGRLARTVQQIERLPPVEAQAPAFDRDDVETNYEWSDAGQLLRMTEERKRFEHQGGRRMRWVDPRGPEAPSARRLCEGCLLPMVLNGGTLLVVGVTTRTTELHYGDDAFVRGVKISTTEKIADPTTRVLRERGSFGPEVKTVDFEYEGETVAGVQRLIRYEMQRGRRVLDRRLESDAKGRVIREASFDQKGDLAYELAHRYDLEGRRVQTVKTLVVAGDNRPTSTTTYTYDPLGRLFFAKQNREKAPRQYDHEGMCTSTHRVAGDPRGSIIDSPLAALEL